MAFEFLFLLLLSFIACSSGTFIKDHQVIQSSSRELLNNFHLKVVEHDELVDPQSLNYPTTPLVTNPVTTPPSINVPPDNSATPTIVTIPATNPIATTPIPVATPAATIPPANPIPAPSTNPIPPAVPVTTPSTNPVTTPTPTGGGVPVTNPVPPAVPVTNPTPTPPNTNAAPTVPGHSWCVAKSGLQEAAIQSAIDYACGIGGADCSAIQQSGNCYNPNSLQNHASYAFNSYYQKNPSPTSCDFGGTAMVTSTNPSSGSCVYPLGSSSSSSPATTSTGAAVPGNSTGAGAGAGADAGFGTGTPPTVLNASNPMPGGAIPGIADSPPTTVSSTSNKFRYFGCISMVAYILTGIITMF